MSEGVEVFERFFHVVHGLEPFAWQKNLAERVIDGPGWPTVVEAPTGFGKTAALDIAVVALALQADRPPTERTAPTRIFLVVDRRLIVDQAFERAHRIARALQESSDEAVKRVADGLRRIGGGTHPLEVVRMRGGVTWSWRWLSSPSQPAVITATVDQFGSRLLFRGYGVGERLRPIDAALCGCDALVLLDEAHLARALAETLRTAHRLEELAENPLLPNRPTRLVRLSATLWEDESADVLRADPDAETSQEARRRLDASRSLALCYVDVKVSKSKSESSKRLAEALATLAIPVVTQAIESKRPVTRVGVVANTVAVARKTFEILREKLGDRVDVELLIGRCRGFERERLGLAERVQTAFAAQNPPPDREKPTLLIATQTIEVGADFDLDVLITEAAPLDALIQRLGRLNRLGLQSQAEAFYVYAKELHDNDTVYGDRIARTWEWLQRQVGDTPPALDSRTPTLSQASRLELSLRAITEYFRSDQLAELRECATAEGLVPKLVQPHLEAWVRTSPAPEPDQPVAPFLHGLDQGSPEVSVCWREGLPSIEAWTAELKAVPIQEEELVEVPLWAAKRFLLGLDPGPLADLETVGEAEAREDVIREVVVQHVDGSIEFLKDAGKLRPGDTVIVDPSRGGHDAWGWTGAGGQVVPDVADLVHRRRPVLRLRPAILSWVTGQEATTFFGRLSQPDTSPRQLAEELLSKALEQARTREDLDPVLSLWIEHAEKMLRALAQGQASVTAPDGLEEPESGLLVQARGVGLGDLGDDESEASTSAAPRPVSLLQHAEDVGKAARRYASHLGFSPELIKAVELAGYLHDVGKAERRFQVMLHQGDPDRFEASGEVLAKSGMDPSDRAGFRRARDRAGLPSRWRHEAVSLAIARRVLQQIKQVEVVDGLLIEHLVATHHGSGRPLFPAVEDKLQVELAPLEDLAQSGMPELATVMSDDYLQIDHIDWAGPRRLATLCQRYGWWGLALLEAVVRLADIAVSEDYK